MFAELWKLSVVVDDGCYQHTKTAHVVVTDKSLVLSEWCKNSGYSIHNVVHSRASFEGIVVVGVYAQKS